MKKVTFGILLLLFLFPLAVFAKIGVGVGTGKIQIDQAIKAGAIYQITPLVVINTGDEASDYTISIQKLEGQEEAIPEEDWFSFEPEVFSLEPGKVQTVQIKLSLPIKDVEPGKYFTFLQARPIASETVKGTSIGVAAASKLYFEVAPSNFFQGLYYRILSIYDNNRPWPQIIIGVILLAIVSVLIKKHVKLNISIAKK